MEKQHQHQKEKQMKIRVKDLMELATTCQYDTIILYDEELNIIKECNTLSYHDIKGLFNDTREVVQFMTDTYSLDIVVK